jgi:hypothetical protein
MNYKWSRVVLIRPRWIGKGKKDGRKRERARERGENFWPLVASYVFLVFNCIVDITLFISSILHVHSIDPVDNLFCHSLEMITNPSGPVLASMTAEAQPQVAIPNSLPACLAQVIVQDANGGNGWIESSLNCFVYELAFSFCQRSEMPRGGSCDSSSVQLTK